ncbi:glycogen debranching protein GlgX [Candidatus Obscuribacterales bacterium]|nr:glycogen debranching protein GlgX [Candidatus Obscuribacterales bacterium]
MTNQTTPRACCHESEPCPIHAISGLPGSANEITHGRSFPLGASVCPGGVNFSIFSTCDRLELLLFDEPESRLPTKVITLDPSWNKTFHYWHVFVPGVSSGQVYAYRAHGPYQPRHGQWFDPQKVLIDPYARAIANTRNYSRLAACQSGDNCATALRSVVVDTSRYDWQDDLPLRTPYSQSVIYELHVGGFTKSPTSGLPVEKRGTYEGLKEKVPYLKSLGVTAVELLPVNQFDDQDAPAGLSNYWGYSPIAFFAPHVQYSSSREPLPAIDEFRDMVKALHKAGIEVILDVVFNHTAEGSHHGPTLSFKGLANNAYYILDPADPAQYANFSGCGNAFRGGNSVALRLILDCLRYWVSEMHVDGFRFDLASVLSRDATGKPQPIELSNVLSAIESDPVLAGTKLIAEAWDATGLYQIGSFVNKLDWFAEWNGPFRDDIRRFIKGDNGSARTAALRLAGSSDIYSRPEREPNRSIHFVTCHDGFTLSDLVSYNSKDNEANGQKNQDGANSNFSWNCGNEGTTTEVEVQGLRTRQIKNFLTVLFIAQGTPMLLMGDERRRTQQGNNNAYCQDNPTSWLNWISNDDTQEILNFTKNLIAFTQSLNVFKQDHLLCAMKNECGCPRISWHGTALNSPDWSYFSHSLAFSLSHPARSESLYIAINAYWKPLLFELPPLPAHYAWHRIIDTFLGSEAFASGNAAPICKKTAYQLRDRSCLIMMAAPSASHSMT